MALRPPSDLIPEDLQAFVDGRFERYATVQGWDDLERERWRFDRIRFAKTVQWLEVLGLQDADVLELGEYSVGSFIFEEYFGCRSWSITEFDLRHRFPLDDRSFDVVVSTEVIEHISDLDFFAYSTFEGARHVLSETRRVLRPAGRMLLTTPNAHSLWVIQRALRREPPLLHEHHYREYTLDEITELVREAGLEVQLAATEKVWHHWDFSAIEQFLADNGYPLDARGDDTFLVAARPLTDDQLEVREHPRLHLAARPDARVSPDDDYADREQADVVREVFRGAPEPLYLLDAGCGRGRISRALVEQGHNVVSLDTSAAMLREVESVLGASGHSQRIEADVRRLPFADGSFDGIVCVQVLEHLPGQLDDGLRSIEELSRVLADDGLLVLQAPLRAPYEDRTVRRALDGRDLEVLGARYLRILPRGLVDRFDDLEGLDRVLERQPELVELAREAVWVARRRVRRGAVSYARPLAFEPSRLAPGPIELDAVRAATAGLAATATRLDQTQVRLAAAKDDIAIQRTSFKQVQRDLERVRDGLEQELSQARGELARVRDDLDRARASHERDRADDQSQIEALEHRLAHAHVELQQVYSSTGWQILQGLWRVRTRVAPRGSARERMLRGSLRTARVVRRLGVRGATRYAVQRALPAPEPFQDRYVPEDTSLVTLYSDDPEMFPGHRPRRWATGSAVVGSPVVSLVATMRNERDNVERWVRGVLAQTSLPDEVVVVDGGSRDGSVEALRRTAAGGPVPFRILEPGPAAIAHSRNVGIEAAHGPVIAVTDFGVQLTPTWLERIVAPFGLDPSTEVVAGFYLARDREGRPLDRRLWPRLDQVNIGSFIPSSRSIAFRKSAWEAVRGYPEWVTLTGEDSFFAHELKRSSRNWAFVPDAIVEWDAPDTLRSYWRKAREWSIGDGETGLNADHYWQGLLRCAAATLVGLAPAVVAGGVGLRRGRPLHAAAIGGVSTAVTTAVVARAARIPPAALLAEYGAQVNRVRGFLEGARRREEVERRRERLRPGVMLVLAGVPIDDTGGGARCTQITLELLRRGWKVVYVNRFPKYESVELGLRIAHPDLETCEWSQFDVDAFLARHLERGSETSVAALIEFPLPEFMPALRSLDEGGVSVVYDLLDDWDTSLGTGWYSEKVEREVADRADVLVGTAPALVERLERMTGSAAAFLPNAVDPRLFDADRPYDVPADLPDGAWRIAYVGALWGDWFDWDLLAAVARRYPDAAVVVIGDYRGQSPVDLPNLHFLGLKAQRQIPAYLAAVDVAIIPWKVNDITRATSPLKLFEYLAMRKPVVAPDLPPLRDIPGVLLAQDRDRFLAGIARARSAPLDRAALDAFLAANTWQARVAHLTELIAKAHLR